jgi:hypothetical protein
VLWIQVEGDIQWAYHTLIVNTSEQATQLSEHAAQRVKRIVDIAHPNCIWSLVRVMGSNNYVIEGTYP